MSERVIRSIFETLCIAGGIALGLGLSTTALGAQSSTRTVESDFLAKIVSTARLRTADLVKARKAQGKRFAALSNRERKSDRALRKASPQERMMISNLYSGEKAALYYLNNALERENELLQKVIAAESRGLGSLAMNISGVSFEAGVRAGNANELNAIKERSKANWEKVGDALTPGLREQLQYEHSAFRLAEEVFNREKQLLSDILVATGSPSLQEGLERTARAAREETQRYRNREERLQQSKEAWGVLIAAGGVALVLADILGSTELSPEQKKVRIKMINTHLENDCIHQGGYFVGAGEYTLGHCSKP